MTTPKFEPTADEIAVALDIENRDWDKLSASGKEDLRARKACELRAAYALAHPRFLAEARAADVAEIERLKRDVELSRRREETSRKFWLRDAKEALAGRPQALRNRIELCETRVIGTSNCPVDGMPLIHVEDDKREDAEHAALTAANARIAELEGAAMRLANAADQVGVEYFDTDYLHGSVLEMQNATIVTRAALAKDK